MNEVGNEHPEIEVPIAVGKAEKNRAFRRIGSQNLIVNRLQKQNPKCIKYPDCGQQKHARQPFQCERQPVTYQTQKILHAAWSV